MPKVRAQHAAGTTTTAFPDNVLPQPNPMNIRIHLEPLAAQDVLKKLEGHRFPVTVKNETLERAGMTFTQTIRTLNDEPAARAFIRGLVECEDADIVFEDTFQMPGMRPFSLLTVVLNDNGEAIRAFYG